MIQQAPVGIILGCLGCLGGASGGVKLAKSWCGRRGCFRLVLLVGAGVRSRVSVAIGMAPDSSSSVWIFRKDRSVSPMLLISVDQRLSLRWMAPLFSMPGRASESPFGRMSLAARWVQYRRFGRLSSTKVFVRVSRSCFTGLARTTSGEARLASSRRRRRRGKAPSSFLMFWRLGWYARVGAYWVAV
jgi:hypothetical protein